MKAVITYLKDYFRNTSRPAFIVTMLLVGSLIAANYSLGIERRLQSLSHWYLSVGAFFLFYLVVIALTWGLQYEWSKKETLAPTLTRGGTIKLQPVLTASAGQLRFDRRLLWILLIAPLYFSLKMVPWDLTHFLPNSLSTPWDRYLLLVVQLPLKLLLLFGVLRVCYRSGLLEGDSFRRSVGLTTDNFDARPYFLLLAMLIPLIALASTQQDFLAVYPKVKTLAFLDGHARPLWPWQLLYELSYGLDFLGIETFFRGLLVIGLVRYAGDSVVLPMAAFYCTIHFGKPLGECISSFFGGLILGVLAARTRSIVGGLIVHLGLAWLMELGGWLGHSLR
ncbi:CPBP family intramembrane glutamic endopeptidase [Puia sp. P3]|uniref:CPBP family intramembrane glutamic endopeptidase n=1 Tax=Puia sp. P3 TaxID=3423952 RepID=UPI003D66535C